jgi:hypothetical protein
LGLLGVAAAGRSDPAQQIADEAGELSEPRIVCGNDGSGLGFNPEIGRQRKREYAYSPKR